MSHGSSAGDPYQHTNVSAEGSHALAVVPSTYPAIFVPNLCPGKSHDGATSHDANKHQCHSSSIMSSAPAFSRDANYQDSFYFNANRICSTTTISSPSFASTRVMPSSSTWSSARTMVSTSGFEPNDPLIRRLYGVSQSSSTQTHIYPAGDPRAHEGTFVPASLFQSQKEISHWDNGAQLQPYCPPFDSAGALHGSAPSQGQRGRTGQAYPSLDAVANAAGSARRTQKRAREEDCQLLNPFSSPMATPTLTPGTRRGQKKGGRKSRM